MLQIVKKASICCEICNKWLHLRCSKLTKLQFSTIWKSNEDWFCESCVQEILPFAQIDNSKLKKLFINPQKSKISEFNKEIRNKCRICEKINNNLDIALACTQCRCLTHRKCTRLLTKQIDLHNKLKKLCMY